MPKNPMGDGLHPGSTSGDQEPKPKRQPDQRSVPTRFKKLGVRVEDIGLRNLDKMNLRAAGRIEPDERLTYAISRSSRATSNACTSTPPASRSPRANRCSRSTAQSWSSAQREYAIAAQGSTPEGRQRGKHRRKCEAARRIEPDAPAQLGYFGQAGEGADSVGHGARTLTFRSPVSRHRDREKGGTGHAFHARRRAYQVTNLSSVWVIADVFEQDIGMGQNGGKGHGSHQRLPGLVFTGSITYVYPTAHG